MGAIQPQVELIAQMYAAGTNIHIIAAHFKIPIRTAYSRLKTKKVRARVAELTQQTLDDMQIDTELVIEGISDIAFSRVEETRDRLKALELLGKHVGAFVDRFEDVTDRGHDGWIKMLSVTVVKEDTDDLDFLKLK